MKPRLAMLAILLLGGCGIFGGGGGDDDDHPDATANPGLTITWESRPDAIPGDGDDGMRITRAAFHLSNLRVVGDAGPIALGQLALEWAAEIRPTDIVLKDAPSGMYSRVLFDLAGTDYAYEIMGTVRDNGSDVPFTIRDRSTTSISVDFSIMLAAGAAATIPIRVEADDIAEAVDFTMVAKQDGKFLVEDGHPQLLRVRAALPGAIDVHDGDN